MKIFYVQRKDDPYSAVVHTGNQNDALLIVDDHWRSEDRVNDLIADFGGMSAYCDYLLDKEYSVTQISRGEALEYVERKLDGTTDTFIIL